ncbi:2-acylglycerol O-acyltransferase 2-A-like [Actinia tenebrosa]|uniref:Acyltransferase n=1 Tax=Actinia tenebrosa TaxID=6105 RepID=A0A6P8IPD9_ACTTE|nr:2-acylglycerol O-acyltransferase 2-A-like [Actinia tenebrosa]XP_031568900.1 2-acylglycerol O-acyltransferase 2-A-like [Actinia tenebrosa]XP_031568901.1 2-acylglycerol O-acyltransferase 2-A-like [Actinia tenebrosa]
MNDNRAPASISERLSLALVYVITFSGTTYVLSGVLFILALLCPLFWPFLLFYPVWLWYDWDTPSKGGRPFKYCFVRRWRIFNIIRDYFPITLVKTTELDPNKNYILGYHPHGMLPDGALVCFGSEAAGFGRLFPGIKPRLAMISFFRKYPIFRELVMATGIISVSRDSLEYVLDQKDKGYAVVDVIGGTREVLNTSPSSYHLVLNRRKGFAKLALETGSSLVPVFAFGQNDMFHQPRSSLPSRLGEIFTLWLRVMLKFTTLIIHDVSTFGIIPRRAPITVIVGAPIEVEKVAFPTYDEIDELHSAYVDELKELFDKHKVQYGVHKDTQLILDED